MNEVIENLKQIVKELKEENKLDIEKQLSECGGSIIDIRGAELDLLLEILNRLNK